MSTGYYICLEKDKSSVMETGIIAAHPSGICLYTKHDDNLQKMIYDTAEIIARLHECDRDNIRRNLIVFKVEYNENNIVATHDNHVILHVRHIPAEKIKYIGKFEDLNAENA